MARTDDDDGSSRFRVLVTVCLVVAALYFTQEVLLPFALAGLLSFLLSPLVTRLEHLKFGHVPSVLVVVLFACLALVGLGWVVTDQMIDLAGELPKYETTLRTKARSIRQMFNGQGELTRTLEEVQKELVKKRPDGPADPPPQGPPLGVTEEHPLPVHNVDTPADPLPLRVLRNLIRPILGPLGTTVIVLVLTIFMLLQRHDLRDRLIRLAGTGQVYVTTQAIDEAANKVSRFLLMQLIVNTVFGLGAAVGLFCIGMPNALLWGLLATTFRFVPYVGPWLAAALPVLLSIALFESWTTPLLTFGLFVLLEIVCANVLEPWLYGSHTGISPVGIFAAAAFWTWLWGPIGLVLSMPLTVVLVVLGRYVPQMGFVNVLLSAKPALELGVRFYQRLLAFDDHEAGDLVHQFRQSGSLDELYEKMVLPALSMSERDRNEGHLSDRQLRFLHRFVRDLVKDLKDEYDMTAAAQAVPAGAASEAAARAVPRVKQALKVLCLPAEDVADRLAGQIAAQLLAARGHEALALPLRPTARTAPDQIEQREADCVVISALAPGGAIPAREGCKQLRARFPNLRVVVGLWNAGGELDRTKERLKAAGADFVTTSLTGALAELQKVAEPVEEKVEAGTP